MRRALVGASALCLLALILCVWGIPPPVRAAKPRTLIDTYVYGSSTYAPGSQAALRVLTYASRSETQSEPIRGAEVAIVLRPSRSGAERRLFSGKSDDRGNLDASFRIPAVAAGKYTLEVQTSSALGQDKVSQEVEVLPTARVLLISDKPLYQPGQLIHMRALALRNIDQRPLGKEMLSFEVEDSKGNKVFRRRLSTDEYGIAAARFQLADEINLGAYRLRASFDNAQICAAAEKVVTVKRYVLPKFKVEVTTERKFFLPGQELKGRVNAGYFFGKPVSQGQVTVLASTFDVAFREIAKVQGWTDAGGAYSFSLKLPDHFVGQPLEKGKALVKLDVRVKDKAQHSEQITRTFPVAPSGIQLELVPEAGRVVPGLENVLYAAVTYPDGRPAARADVTLELDGRTLRQSADGVGLARFRFTPKQAQVKATSYWTRKLDAQAELGKVVQLEGEGGKEIETALKGRLSSMQSCYRYQVQRDPTLAGELVAELTLENRRITNVKNIRDTAGPAANCATGYLRWAYTQTAVKGRVQVSVRFFVKGDGKNIVRRYSTEPQHFPVTCTARDSAGNSIKVIEELAALQAKDTLLLRTDRAIYRSTDSVRVDALSSFAGGSLFLDAVSGNQTVLTKTMELKQGRASTNLALGGLLSGTVVLRAYRVFPDGNIVRDTKVVYVHPASDLRIGVEPDKRSYQPGQEARISFKVTDAAGRGVASALGLTVVDESVYALQEMQPGLEKVYFTLERELSQPKYQIKYAPEGLDLEELILQKRVLEDQRQQVAQVLLAKAKLGADFGWSRHPLLERRQKDQARIGKLQSAVRDYMRRHNVGAWIKKQMTFRPGLLLEIVRSGKLKADDLKDAWDNTTTVATLGLDFQSEAENVSYERLNHLTELLRPDFHKRWRQRLSQAQLEELVEQLIQRRRIPAYLLRDGWGRKLRFAVRGEDARHFTYEVRSAGPNGRFERRDGGDDLQEIIFGIYPVRRYARRAAMRDGSIGLGAVGSIGRGGGGGFGRSAPMEASVAAKTAMAGRGPAPAGAGAGAEPQVRIREYFPETLLFLPRLITDASGAASLKLSLADSITSWRLSAMASSQQGLLGSIDKGITVFQDFFVDLDLPVSLTQNDEVAVPVAIYNYLKTAQQLRLRVDQAAWFELLGWSRDGRTVEAKGTELALGMKANEVDVRYLRLRAKGIGQQKLTVMAFGQKMSDAIRREIEVRPDGKEQLVSFSDRLGGKAQHDVEIPPQAIPDASGLFVKIYPGVFSQVVEGLDKVFRMPFG